MARKPTSSGPPDEEAARRKASNDLAIARATALNAYADLERSLGLLFDELLGTNTRKSYIVF
jgi:hypothetical protein